jgi:hypothetical protein
MFELLVNKLEGPGMIMLMMVLGGLALAALGILATYWFKGRELSLKEAMIARGMSVQEIAAVLKAGAAGSTPTLDDSSPGPANEWTLKQSIACQMIEEGRSAEDIQIVLQAVAISRPQGDATLVTADELAFKKHIVSQMIEEGKSAEEIQTVLLAAGVARPKDEAINA